MRGITVTAGDSLGIGFSIRMTIQIIVWGKTKLLYRKYPTDTRFSRV